MPLNKAVLFFINWFLYASFAQAQMLNVKKYTFDDGLPQLYFNAISQDKNAQLFFSTEDGLVSYDSKAFTVYTAKNGLAENHITTHFIDSKNTVWTGHFSNGISYLQNGICYKINSSAIKNARITSITQNKNCIWASSDAHGFFKIDENKNVTVFNSEGSNNIYWIKFFKNNLLVAGTNKGVSIYDVSNLPKKLSEIFISDALQFSSCATIDDNKMLIATKRNGVFLLNNFAKRFTLKPIETINSALEKTEINSAYFHNSSLYLSTNNGLQKFEYLKSEFSLKRTLSTNNGLSSNYIASCFADAQGNIWIGSNGFGLSQLIDEKFLYHNQNLFKTTDNNVKAICGNDNDGFWIACNNSIFEIDFKLKKIVQQHKFGVDEVRCLFVDDNKKLYIGTAQKGVFVLDIKTKKITHFSKQLSLPETNINSIAAAGNTIYFAGNDGLFVYNKLANLCKQFTTSEGLSHNVIKQVFCDSKNRVWFAAHGSAPFCYYNGEFIIYKDITDVLTFKFNTISEDKNGNIWFGTDGEGVYKFNGKKFEHFTAANAALSSNYCYSSICDKQNNLWIGHKNGISVLYNSAKKFKVYNHQHGVAVVNNNDLAIAIIGKKGLLFGTVNGVVEYNGNADNANTSSPKVIVKYVDINGKKTFAANKLILNYNKYQVKIAFIAPDYSHSNTIKYRYKLDGLETDWNYLNGSNEQISYAKISDGNYYFRIQSSIDGTRWNKDETNFELIIEAPYWKHWWFVIACIILLYLFIKFYIDFKTKKYLKSQQFLEEKINEKTSTILDKNAELEIQKAHLDEINTDLTDSINYARRIQEAILPQRTILGNKEEDVFIFYQPRDIVCGDFFWINPISNHEIIYVVADCTGHGVPGAMLTMLGSSLLNQIVKEFKITNPKIILKKLDELVRESLHQDTNYSSTDGMDTAIIKINYNTMQMEYAGAKRPVYICRNKEIIDFKPSIFSVGAYNYGDEKIFENCNFSLQKNDMIYAFSDGYSDQFGGPENKKYMSKKLKNLLVEISDKSIMKQQFTISTEINNWKGNGKQTDDILLMGIKI